MNSSEVLFCALLLTKDAESVPNGISRLQIWSSAVLAEEKHALELEAAWKPRTDKRTAIDYFGPLERVFKRSWPYAELTLSFMGSMPVARRRLPSTPTSLRCLRCLRRRR